MRVSAATLAGWDRYRGWSSIAAALIENSLDAGAGRVAVQLTEAGLTVADTGTGFADAQWQQSFERGAACSVRTDADLANLSRFGMRGESLYLLRRVARVSRAASAGPGATISVRRFRLPTGELPSALDASDVLTTVHRYALAWPDVQFSLAHGEQVCYATDASPKRKKAARKAKQQPAEEGAAPDGSAPERPALLARLSAILGGKFKDGDMAPVEGEIADLDGELVGGVTGYLVWPSTTAEDDSRLFVSVNGIPLPLRGGVLACIRESCSPAPMESRWPLGVLNLRVPSSLLDRLGTEVRLARLPRGTPNPVYYGLGYAIWAALSGWRAEMQCSKTR